MRDYSPGFDEVCTCTVDDGDVETLRPRQIQHPLVLITALLRSHCCHPLAYQQRRETFSCRTRGTLTRLHVLTGVGSTCTIRFGHIRPTSLVPSHLKPSSPGN